MGAKSGTDLIAESLNYTTVKLSDAVHDNYMPYAVSTILERAIPDLRDGCKPVQRKILYDMHELKLMNSTDTNVKVKSARIVGDTMGKYHPHGDGSIYDAMCNMSDVNGRLNAPLVKGRGGLGDISHVGSPSAMRYTEAGLTPIGSEMFDGLNENAVDMVPNFDNSEKEPECLPVKFPNVLVNATEGIAVGMGSNTPTYNLDKVCNAVEAIIRGEAEKPEDLVDILGAPDFSTGGFIHISEKEILRLIKTGSGSVSVSGAVKLTKDTIIIKELPYGITIDSVINDANACAKPDKDTGIVKIKDIVRAVDASDKNGLRGIVEVKRSGDVHEVLRKLNIYTKLRTKISFKTSVIWKGRCIESVGIFKLLKDMWIPWRIQTIRRQKRFVLMKKRESEHTTAVWEKLNGRVKEAVDILSKMDEDAAKAEFIRTFGLDDAQAEYLLDVKLRSITDKRIQKKLDDLRKIRAEIAELESIISDDKVVGQYIIDQQEEIKRKYGADRKTKVTAPIKIETVKDLAGEKKEVEDYLTHVVVTEKGYIKKIRRGVDVKSAAEDMEGIDKIKFDILCRNPEQLLVYTYSGFCYKIPVAAVDDTRGGFKSIIWNMIQRDKDDTSNSIFYITNTADFSEVFNIVYPDGRGKRVRTSAYSGKRRAYKNAFPAAESGTLKLIKSDKFFVITNKRKACYVSINEGEKQVKTFKTAHMRDGEQVYELLPADEVPDISTIDLSKYTKPYTSSIGTDKLWYTKAEREELERQKLERITAVNENGNAAAAEESTEDDTEGIECTAEDMEAMQRAAAAMGVGIGVTA